MMTDENLLQLAIKLLDGPLYDSEGSLDTKATLPTEAACILATELRKVRDQVWNEALDAAVAVPDENTFDPYNIIQGIKRLKVKT